MEATPPAPPIEYSNPCGTLETMLRRAGNLRTLEYHVHPTNAYPTTFTGECYVEFGTDQAAAAEEALRSRELAHLLPLLGPRQPSVLAVGHALRRAMVGAETLWGESTPPPTLGCGATDRQSVIKFAEEAWEKVLKPVMPQLMELMRDHEMVQVDFEEACARWDQAAAEAAAEAAAPAGGE